MDERSRNRERLEDLLVQRAIEGLSQAEQTELERLGAEFPEVDTSAFDRIAATIWLAASQPRENMPPDLQEKIMRRAGRDRR